MEKLFRNLMQLCSDPKSMFFFNDKDTGFGLYRVFSYHFATYTEWQLSDALECRRIMFEIDTAGNPLRIACRPMEKFFNVNENPFTQNLDFSKVKTWAYKMDGSLISSYLDGDGKVKLKSKTSLLSEQATDAMNFVQTQHGLWWYVEAFTKDGFTVNMEWTSPKNRIVVPYEKPALTVLNVRHNDTGEYLSKELAARDLPGVQKFWCEEREMHEPDPLEYVKNMINIEGFVLTFENGLRAKLKTDWYIRLHRTKDTVSSSKRLYEALVSGQYDDLMGLWYQEPTMCSRISEMHSKVGNVMIGLTSVHDFYRNNKELDRKSYALKGQAEIPDLFHMAMELYKGKEADFKTHMLKNIEKYLPMCELPDLQVSTED